MPHVIEMRIYRIKAGKREKFLDIFREKTIPAHIEIGMKILGPFPSIDDPNVFFWMRAFPDAASREPMKDAFYSSDLWRSELEQVLLPLLEKYEVVLVEDTEGLFEE